MLDDIARDFQEAPLVLKWDQGPLCSVMNQSRALRLVPVSHSGPLGWWRSTATRLGMQQQRISPNSMRSPMTHVGLLGDATHAPKADCERKSYTQRLR
jgi:hypothetical protein